MNRRGFLALSASLAATACAQTPSLQLARDSFSLLGTSSSAYPRTREAVEALPYAQLGIRIGGGSRGIMVLSERSGDDLQWISANRVLLVTRHGRIVRTVGLPGDLSASKAYGPDLLEQYDDTTPLTPLKPVVRSIDIGSVFGTVIESRFEIEGEETIEILGESHETVRVREDMQSSSSRKWRRSNRYWLSKLSPLAWRSVQYLNSDLAPIELEMLKRPG